GPAGVRRRCLVGHDLEGARGTVGARDRDRRVRPSRPAPCERLTPLAPRGQGYHLLKPCPSASTSSTSRLSASVPLTEGKSTRSSLRFPRRSSAARIAAACARPAAPI